MRDLFAPDPAVNLLPSDGVVHYHGPVMSVPEAGRFLEALQKDIPWRPDEAVIFGRRIQTARKVAWYGDEAYEYTYSGATKRALAWTEDLLKLKAIAEERTGERFNSCLLNLYHDGSEGMAWHSDGEKMLVRHGAIASLSLGAERKFSFKHKATKETVSLTLEHGSLLEMKGPTQTHWLHRLPPTKKGLTERVNLTFRQMDV